MTIAQIQASSGQPVWGKYHDLGVLCFCLALAAIHLFGLNNNLVFDDLLLTQSGFYDLYGHGIALHQRFLAYGSFIWLEQVWGAGWWKQRLFNDVLHGLVVFSLFGFYRTLLAALPETVFPGERRGWNWALLVGVAFFALNPVAVYGVDYLVQRSILMATLFVVLGLWAFTWALVSGRRGFFLGAVVCYLLALASKEHALLAPLGLLPIYTLLRRPSLRQLLQGLLLGLVLSSLAAGVFLSVYGQIIGVAFDEFSRAFLAQLSSLSPGVLDRAYPLSIFNQLHLFSQYGLRWLMPWSGWLSIDLRPPFPLEFWSFPHLLGAPVYFLCLLGGGWLVFRWQDWRGLLGFCLLFPALLFGTEFATVWVQDPFVLYRSYLWAIPLPLLVFLVLHDLSPKVIAGIGLVLCGVLSLGVIDRINSLSSPVEAWGDAIDKLGNDVRSVGRWRPYLNRGSAYLDRGLTNSALKDYDHAEQVGDIQGFGLFNKGVIALTLAHQPAPALKFFSLAERKGYEGPELPYQRGMALRNLGQLEAAKHSFEQALSNQLAPPLSWSAQAELGKIALDQGHPEETIRLLPEVLPHLPNDVFASLALGLAYALTNQPQPALPLLSSVLMKTPVAPAYYGRALVFKNLNRREEALADIDMALKQDPRNPRFAELRQQILARP